MALPRPELLDLTSYLSERRIVFLPADIAKPEALDRLAEACAADPAVRDPAHLVEAIHERERVSSTGIGNGIAVPHAKLHTIDDFVIAIGVCADGIDFGARDQQPVSIMVMIAASDRLREQYLKLLATVATRLKHAARCERIRAAADPAVVIEAITTEY